MGPEAMGVANANLVWSDEKVCRNFLCGTCPHALFTNTVSTISIKSPFPSPSPPNEICKTNTNNNMNIKNQHKLLPTLCYLLENGPRRLPKIPHRATKDGIQRSERSIPKRSDIQQVSNGIRVEYLCVCG